MGSAYPCKKMTLSVSLLAFLTAAAVHARSPQVHRLEATPATIVYGYYWSEAPPALRIASGDVIDVDTLLTNTPEGLAKAGVSDDRIQTSLKEIVSQVTGDRRGPRGHILTGVAPAPEAGRVSSDPPGRHAGNLDNRELVVGSTLDIPVFARGALFEVGDGHVAQGDGEVDQTAIETSLRARLQLTVRKDMKLTWPRAKTPTDYISMATDPDLNVATRTAIQEMVDFLVTEKQLRRHEAYQLVSIAGNVAITMSTGPKGGPFQSLRAQTHANHRRS